MPAKVVDASVLGALLSGEPRAHYTTVNCFSFHWIARTDTSRRVRILSPGWS